MSAPVDATAVHERALQLVDARLAQVRDLGGGYLEGTWPLDGIAKLAETAHWGCSDIAGYPDFDHAAAVAGVLADRGADELTVAAGWLHHVVDDTPFSGVALASLGVDRAVIDVAMRTFTRRRTRRDDAGILAGARFWAVTAACVAARTDPEWLGALDPATARDEVESLAYALTLGPTLP